MVYLLKEQHKGHLAILISHPIEFLQEICKLPIEFLCSGSNQKRIAASKKLDINPEIFQKALKGIANLLFESSKHNLNEQEFRESLILLGFPEEHQIILNEFYTKRKSEIRKVLSLLKLNTNHYKDLDWRFEIQVASRSLLKQARPQVTLQFSLTDSKEGTDLQRKVLQVDPGTLGHITHTLEQALLESRSHHTKRVQRNLQ